MSGGNYPIEALLRSPIEFVSSIISFSMAVLVLVIPDFLMLVPVVSYGTATLLGIFGLYRFSQGYYVYRYQKNLIRSKVHTISSRKLKKSMKYFFIGIGFLWTEKHTQRLRDTRNTDMREFAIPGLFYYWLRDFEISCDKNWYLRWLGLLIGWDCWINPFKAYPNMGGQPAIHGVELNYRELSFELANRTGHTLVLGTTRVGKTEFAKLLIRQDIIRGDVVIVFDPKGSPDLLKDIYTQCCLSGRTDDFMMFHLGFPDESVRYNAVGNFSRITEIATRVANQLVKEGNSAAFKEFGWRFVNIVAKARYVLGERIDYKKILADLLDMDDLYIQYVKHWLDNQNYQDFDSKIESLIGAITEKNTPFNLRGRRSEVIAIERLLDMETELDFSSDMVINGLRSGIRYDKTYFDKITASLLPFLEKLTTGRVAELISPDYFDENDSRPIFDWLKVIRQKKVIYIGLDALADSEVAQAVGNSMFADLVSTAGQLTTTGLDFGLPETIANSRINLHLDEFSDLMGDEFIPMINKSGQSGFQITAYSQTQSDIESAAGSKSKAGMVKGNFNSIYMLRVKEPETAEILTKQLPLVQVRTLTSVTGINDSADPDSDTHFTSRNDDRIQSTDVEMLAISDVLALPVGEAFALMNGSHLYKFRIPLVEDRNVLIPSKLNDILVEMKDKYKTSEQWWISSRGVA